MEGLIKIKGIKNYLEKIGKILRDDPSDEEKLEKISNSFFSYLKKFASDKYIPEFSLNHIIPYISIRIPNNHIYIEYVVSEDKKGIYLSISHGIIPMQNILSANGPKIGLRSPKEINSFVNRAKNPIEHIRAQISISESFSPEMDLNAKKIARAPLFEVCSIYSKFYSFDNLPSEKKLESDFKEILKSYSSLVEPSVDLRTPFETIFKKLPLAIKRNETVKGHSLGSEFSKISNDILKIANSIHPEISYNSISYYQANGKWYKTPYIYIEDRANKDKFGHWDQHFVIYDFTEDLDGVYVSLTQSGNYAQNFLKDNEEDLEKYINDHKKQIKKQLEKSNKISESLLKESIKINSYSGRKIYGKFYDKNSLPSNDQMIDDFKELFNLYSQLKPDERESNGLLIIEDENEIKNAQIKFESIFKNESESIFVGNKEYVWHSKFGIWMSSGKNPNSFFNLFGIGKPISTCNETIVEINIPFTGINKNISGAFAKDTNGNIFLLHSGKLGGKNVGKNLLEENYSCRLGRNSRWK